MEILPALTFPFFLFRFPTVFCLFVQHNDKKHSSCLIKKQHQRNKRLKKYNETVKKIRVLNRLVIIRLYPLLNMLK